jgi:tetratricopeptide (TPR) repeat protein
MVIRNQIGLALSIFLLTASCATAAPQLNPESVASPSLTPTLSDKAKLEIDNQVQQEVDRAFGHTTAILNILLVVLTMLPIFAAAGVWLLRRSVISEVVAETKKRLEEEVETQLEKEVAAEFKKQTDAFKQELEILKSDFIAQLSQLNNLFLDAQNQKEQILQQLSGLTPSPSLTQDFIHPEIQRKIQDLTTQLEILKLANPQILFTANDYLKQGDALFFEGQFEEALTYYDQVIQREPNLYVAWVNHGWTLRKLGRYSEALLSYEKAITIQSDHHIAWFGCGNSLRKLRRNKEAIAAYNKTLELQPDFHWAWSHKSRCYALNGNVDLAIESLEQALKFKGVQHRELAKTHPDFDAIRTDERFQKLIKG